MGTFGFGPFDNDDALDFLDEIEDAAPTDRPVLLRAALEQVLGIRGYLDAAKMSEAIAAAAIVSVALRPHEPCAEPDLSRWLQTEPLLMDASLVDTARQVLDRAMAPDDNELWTLWVDAGVLPDVLAGLAPTLRRLRAIPV